jgi:hypothetical protein
LPADAFAALESLIRWRARRGTSRRPAHPCAHPRSAEDRPLLALAVALWTWLLSARYVTASVSAT